MAMWSGNPHGGTVAREGGAKLCSSSCPKGSTQRRADAMDVPEEILAAEQRATELYWGSDSSVNQIAEELDLSKSALYGIIRPLPAEVECPVCRSEVVFANRTARQRGRVSCPQCTWEGSADETVLFAEEDEDLEPFDYLELPPPASRDRELGRTVIGGALLGAAAGLALVFWARRR